MIVVDRELSLRTLELYRDLGLIFLDVVIFPEGLIAVCQDLDAQWAIRNALEIGLTFRIGLQFQTAPFLFAFRIHWMHDHGRIAHGLPGIVLDHGKVDP